MGMTCKYITLSFGGDYIPISRQLQNQGISFNPNMCENWERYEKSLIFLENCGILKADEVRTANERLLKMIVEYLERN